MNPAQLLVHFDRISEAPDAIPRLRRFILDLGVRGKLVEQDPKNEPAPELLKQIYAARALLAKSGKIRRPELLDPIAPDEVPFEVPPHWALIRLGDALELINGRAFKPNEWSTDGIPIIRIQNLNNEDAPFNHCDTAIPEKFHVKTGDFLISWSGTPGTSFGAHIWERGHALLNQHIFRAELIGAGFLLPFLKLAINSRLLELIDQAHGGAGLQHITKPKLEELPLTLPPLTEQHRIVAKVDELMALCGRLEAAQTERESRRDRLVAATLQRLNQPDNGDATSFRENSRFHLRNIPRLTTRPEQIQQLRQTILNLAVRGRLAPQSLNDEPASKLLAQVAAQKAIQSDARNGRDWVGGKTRTLNEEFVVPFGWSWTRIANAVERVTVGYVGPMKDQYVEGGIPFLRSQNVRANQFREDGLISISPEFHRTIAKSALAPGDVVVVRSGNIGTACVIPSTLPEANCSDLVVVKNPLAVLPTYLSFYLNSLAAIHIEAGAVGVALTHFNTKSVATMPLPLPPLAEQHRIVAKVDELIALCGQLEAQLASIRTESQRMLEAVLHEALARAA